MENIKEKIYRNAFIITAVTSFLFGALRIAAILKNSVLSNHLMFASFEGLIFVLSVLCLVIGSLTGKNFFEKSFYAVAKTALFYFALTLPVNLMIQGYIRPYESLIAILFAVGIYLAYSFIHHGICFNASFLENENYFKCVFKNIGKSGIYFLLCLLLSLCGAIVIKVLGVNIISYIIYIYAVVYILMSLVYLFCSVLEKERHDKYIGLSKCTYLVFIGVIVIRAVQSVSLFIVEYVSIIDPLKAQLVKALNVINDIDTFITFAFIIYLVYFVYEYQKINANNLMKNGCLILAVTETVCKILNVMISDILSIFMSEITHKNGRLGLIIDISNYINILAGIITVIGLYLMINALIKDRMISRANVISVIILLAYVICEMFLNGRVDILALSILKLSIELLTPIYLCFIVREVTAKTPAPLDMSL